jgi:hypothetical protein
MKLAKVENSFVLNFLRDANVIFLLEKFNFIHSKGETSEGDIPLK